MEHEHKYLAINLDTEVSPEKQFNMYAADGWRVQHFQVLNRYPDAEQGKRGPLIMHVVMVRMKSMKFFEDKKK